MSKPHRELRWKYETDAHAAQRMSPRAELITGISSLALSGAGLFGAHVALEADNKLFAAALAGGSLLALRIGSRYMAQQCNDGITYLQNKYMSKGE